jgi:hypothetical protein
MSRITNLFILTLGLSMLFACANSDSPSSNSKGVVTDTMGQPFDVNCSSTLCTLTPRDPGLKPNSCSVGGGTDTFALIWGRILAVQVLKISTSGEFQLNAAEPGHPVICTTDANCLSPGISLIGGTAVFTCLNGLCQNLDISLMTNDVLTLCQADIQWPEVNECPYITLPKFAERIAQVAETCGSALYCSAIPASCRQLTPNLGIDGGP